MRESLPSIENKGVNDLIFRQFVLRGFKEEEGIRTWDIADSKLWYLTPKQAKGFLTIEHSPEYSAAVTEKERMLLKEHIGAIASGMNRKPTNLIDLGCGDGKKAVLCLKDFINEFQIRYCPIDISAYMVQEAAHAVEQSGLAPVERIFWNISDFENLDNVTPLFRNKDFPHHCLLFLGNTLGNFEHNDILHGIRRGMDKGEVLIIGNGISEGRTPEEWVQTYTSSQMDDFAVQVLLEAGFSRDNLRFDVRYVRDRIEVCYIVQNDVVLKHLGRSLEYKTGDVIRTVISYKYSQKQLKEMLEQFFDEVVVQTDVDNTYGLAICRVN